jgi:hypothetical protein
MPRGVNLGVWIQVFSGILLSGKTYLNLTASNNNVDRIWGIYQCEVSFVAGNCDGEYISLLDGTLTHNSTARDESPKMFLGIPIIIFSLQKA